MKKSLLVLSLLVQIISFGQLKNEVKQYNSENKELLKELESQFKNFDSIKTENIEQIKAFQKQMNVSIKSILKTFKKKNKTAMKLIKRNGIESDLMDHFNSCFEENYAQVYMEESQDQLITSDYPEFYMWKDQSKWSFKKSINRLKQQISCIEYGLKKY